MDFPPEPNRAVESEKFAVEPVQFQFAISAIVALAVANNTLCLALKSGRIIRIDLDNPESVDDVDVKDGGCDIENLFLDPTGSYLLITTKTRDNYVLNYQTTKVKSLGRLRDLAITCVAWSPIESSLSSGEVLLGTADGCVYETCLEFSDEYFKREDRYVRKVAEFKSADSHVVTPITGIVVQLGSSPNYRKIIVSNANGHAYYYSGKISAHLQDGIPVYTKFFEREEHVDQEFGADSGRAAMLSATPPDPKSSSWAFALLSGVGIVHRTIKKDENDTLESRKTFFQGSNIYILNQIQESSIVGMCLTSFHMAIATETKLYIVNRFSHELVFEQQVTQGHETLTGLTVDPKQHTFWLFSAENIYEITVDDESRGMWKLVLEQGDLDEAMRLSENDPDPSSQDELLGILGDKQIKEKDYLGAANTYGNSRKRPLEQTALLFLDANQPEALLKYLQNKLTAFPKANVTQRLLVSTWIIELFMEQFNKLDDQEATSDSPLDEQRRVLSTKFHDFVTKYKGDLHKGTVFEIMSVNGRQEELLYYAAAIQDYNFVLQYWVGLENWTKALQVLRQVKSEEDRALLYKYSTVLLVHAARDTVDTWIVIGKEIEPTKMVPALLNYSQTVKPGKVASDQAVRYLKNVVGKQGSRDPIIHNTLISLLSMSPQTEEAELLDYLQECSALQQLPYDVDFALRTCIRCKRFESCVHIYCNIHMYHEAVKLALNHGRLELAIKVVEQTRDLDESDAAYTPDLCKNLWFAIVKHVIEESDKSDEIPLSQVVSLLKQSQVLKIEDVLPLFPDFVVVDDFKQAICDSLESYNSNLVNIQREMKDSIATADKIRTEIEHTEQKRYVIVEPGESCALSGYPLLSKKFYVFPCQHAIRADALTEAVVKNASYKLKKRISELQSRGVSCKKELEEVLDDVISEKCFICSDIKVDLIENSLMPQGKSEWDL